MADERSWQMSDNAIQTLRARYLMKDESGGIVETPEQLFRRVARCVAAAEAAYGASRDQLKRIEKNSSISCSMGCFFRTVRR